VTTDAKRPAAVATAILEDRTMPKPVKRANIPPLGVKAPYLVLWKLAATEPHLVSLGSQWILSINTPETIPFEPNPTLRSSVRVKTKTVHQIMVSGTSSEACQSANLGGSDKGIAHAQRTRL